MHLTHFDAPFWHFLKYTSSSHCFIPFLPKKMHNLKLGIAFFVLDSLCGYRTWITGMEEMVIKHILAHYVNKIRAECLSASSLVKNEVPCHLQQGKIVKLESFDFLEVNFQLV